MLGRRRKSIVIILLLMGTLIPLVQPIIVVSDLSNPSVLANHSPIVINGDSQFTLANGVVSGNGTQGNPYIIENWSIDATNNHGINIENTNARFIIRNCHIYNGSNGSGSIEGIYLNNVENGMIIDNRLVSNYDGIYLYDSKNITIQNNTIFFTEFFGIKVSFSNSNFIFDNNIKDNYYGIFLSGSLYNNIYNNTIFNNTDHGIRIIWGSHYNNVHHNIIFNNSKGILIYEGDYCDHNVIYQNTIFNNSMWGIYLAYSRFNKVYNNNITNNKNGLVLAGGTKNNIFHSNKINKCETGLFLYQSEGNSFYNNSLTNNTLYIKIENTNLLKYYNTNMPPNNTLEDKKVYYLINESNKIIPKDAGFVALVNCVNISVANLNLTKNSHEIILHSSNNISIINNSIYGSIFGLLIRGSNNNTIKNNRVYNNYEGFNITGSWNIIQNNSIYFNSKGIFIFGTSTYNTLKNNSLYNNTYSLFLFNLLSSTEFTFTTIENNSVFNSSYGIYLCRTGKNVIINNTIYNNTNGLFFNSRSNYNNIYNNYFSNSNNYIVSGCIGNIWNMSKKMGENIIGGPYLGGNYWSNYSGIDNNGDGLGDTKVPYGPGDYLPLCTPNDLVKPNILDETVKKPVTGKDFKFYVNVSDNIGVKSVHVEYGFDSNPQSKLDMVRLSGDGRSGTYYANFTTPTTVSNLYYFFWANDTYGNFRQTSTFSLNVIDIFDPEIGNNNTPNIAYTGDPHMFSIECTDNIEVGTGWVFYRYGMGQYIQEQLIGYGDIYSKTILVANTLEHIYYYFSIKDTSNNWNNTTISKIKVIDNDPPELVEDLSDTVAYTNKDFNFSALISDNIEPISASIEYYYGVLGNHKTIPLAKDSNYFNGSITIHNSLEKLNYRFLFSDSNPINTNYNKFKQIDVLDADRPEVLSGSGNIKTTTGESFELFAEFSDNIGFKLVKIFYSKSTDWNMKEVTPSTGGKYVITTQELSIDTTHDITPWKYYFYAEDTSGNYVFYGTEENPFIIIVIDNDKPVADAGKDYYVYETNTYVTFDASNSTDNVGIVNYSWTFEYWGKDIKLFGKVTKFKFEITDQYQIILEVTDPGGNTATDEWIIYVFSTQEPTVYLYSPQNNAELPGPRVYLNWRVIADSFLPCLYECDVYLGTDPDPPLYEAKVSEEELEVVIFEEMVDYYWKVKLSDSCGPGSETETWSFRVSNAVPEYGVELKSNETTVFIEQEQSKSIQLIVKNTQNRYSDRFALEFDKDNFPGEVELSNKLLLVGPGEVGMAFLNLSTTATTVVGNYQIKITARSIGALEYDLDINQSLILLVIVYNISQPEVDKDNDNLPDNWELHWFRNITKYNGTDDPDADGKTNYQEYLNDTNPTKPDQDTKPEKPDEDNIVIMIAFVLVPIVFFVIILIFFIFLRKKRGGGEQTEIQPRESINIETEAPKSKSNQQQPQKSDFLDYRVHDQDGLRKY